MKVESVEVCARKNVHERAVFDRLAARTDYDREELEALRKSCSLASADKVEAVCQTSEGDSKVLRM